jgi:hypothetical protein
VCFADGAVVARCCGRFALVSTRQSVTAGFAIQIAGFATIALALEFGGAVGQSGVPIGAVLLGLGVAVSSSLQVSILKAGAKTSTIGKVDAPRQPVIGLTTAVTLTAVRHIVDVDLVAAYGTVVAVLVVDGPVGECGGRQPREGRSLFTRSPRIRQGSAKEPVPNCRHEATPADNRGVRK